MAVRGIGVKLSLLDDLAEELATELAALLDDEKLDEILLLTALTLLTELELLTELTLLTELKLVTELELVTEFQLLVELALLEDKLRGARLLLAALDWLDESALDNERTEETLIAKELCADETAIGETLDNEALEETRFADDDWDEGLSQTAPVSSGTWAATPAGLVPSSQNSINWPGLIILFLDKCLAL